MSCPLCKSGNRFMLRRPETGSTHNCTIRFKTELCPKSEIEIPAFFSVSVLVAQLCPTHCDPMGWGLPGSSIHGIFQARILEWVAIPFSRGSSWVRDQTWVSRIAGRFFRIWNHQERVIKSKAIYFHLLCPSTWFTPDILLPVNSTFFFKMKLSSS